MTKKYSKLTDLLHNFTNLSNSPRTKEYKIGGNNITAIGILTKTYTNLIKIVMLKPNKRSYIVNIGQTGKKNITFKFHVHA